MFSNFPVWLFDCSDEEAPDWPTFGLLLVEPDPKAPITERIPGPEHVPRGARGLITLLSSMVRLMMEEHDRLYLEKAQYARTIPMPILTLGVGTTVRPFAGSGRGSVRVGPHGSRGFPRDLGLRDLHRRVPEGKDARG
jgi:NTE family protein